MLIHMVKKRVYVYMEDAEIKLLDDMAHHLDMDRSEVARLAIIHSFPWLDRQASIRQRRLEKE